MQTWGMGSGCAPFYNTCKEGTANTRMVRFFKEDRFEIYATRDIAEGDDAEAATATQIKAEQAAQRAEARAIR